MAPVNEDTCFKILERGLRVAETNFPQLASAVFFGKPADWENAADPNFQKLLQEHDISSETKICIWQTGQDTYKVARESEVVEARLKGF